MTKFNGALAAGLAIAAISSFTQPAAAAIEYPWCVQYSGGPNGGGRNCGFVSFDQCMMTARGAGGMCQPNVFYPGTTEPPQRVQHKRQRNG